LLVAFNFACCGAFTADNRETYFGAIGVHFHFLRIQ
jgi:hypothetical protein